MITPEQILGYTVGNITLTPEQLAEADINKDGKVGSYDAALLKQMGTAPVQPTTEKTGTTNGGGMTTGAGATGGALPTTIMPPPNSGPVSVGVSVSSDGGGTSASDTTNIDVLQNKNVVIILIAVIFLMFLAKD